MTDAEQRAWATILDKLAASGERASVMLRDVRGGSFVGKIRRLDEFFGLGFYQVEEVLTIIGENQKLVRIPTWLTFHVSGVACLSNAPEPVVADQRPTGLTDADLAELGMPPGYVR